LLSKQHRGTAANIPSPSLVSTSRNQQSNNQRTEHPAAHKSDQKTHSQHLPSYSMITEISAIAMLITVPQANASRKASIITA
jgi:hypothetical protein